MKVREAIATDSDRIRTIAEGSFETSYALSPLDIETIIEAEFDDDGIETRIDDDEAIVMVAEGDEAVLGFAEARIRNDQRGELVWLHVDPTERGRGAGTELIEAVLARLRERAAEGIEAPILAENQEGGEFIERFEFGRKGQTERAFGGEEFRAEVYTDVDPEQRTEPTVPESGEIEVDGETRYLDAEESISGDEREFLFVFAEDRREERFGFYCTNCGSFTDSVDGQGKVICEECGNEHNPEEWDGSYL